MSQVYNRYAWALTAPQKQAAYHAGQQDAAVFAAKGRSAAEAPVDTGTEAGYNGAEGGKSYGNQHRETAGDYRRGEDPGTDAGGTGGATGADAEGPGRIPAWAREAQVREPGEPAKQAVTLLKIKQAKQTMTAQVETLPEDHRQALRNYTGFAAFRINNAIRNGKITPEIQQEIDLLDAALKDGVMPETVVLHRDTALSFLGLGLSEKPTARELAKIVGRPITNRIFTSTSFNNLGFRGRDTELVLTVPAGYKGCRYIKSVASPKYAHQEEVLFARGLRYKITEARIENGKYVLFAEVLP